MNRFLTFICVWTAFIIAEGETYTPCFLCLNTASSTTLADIEVRQYTGPTVSNYTSVKVDDVLNLYSKLDNSKPTIVFIYGWLATPTTPSSEAMAEAHTTRGDANFLMLDWNHISIANYIYALNSVPGVGHTLATVLNKLVERGLNTTGLECVGHSLGAHICGWAGSFVNFKLARITGLDPGGPGYYIFGRSLDRNDAERVFIIHTDRFVFGFPFQIGHADFYPNNGVPSQPGCRAGTLSENICSHYRAVYYYATSVRRAGSMIGRSCYSYDDFKTGKCNSNEMAIMGYGAPYSARGRYYLDIIGEAFSNQDGETAVTHSFGSLLPRLGALLGTVVSIFTI